MRFKINPKYRDLEEFVKGLPDEFETTGETLYKQRNEIKRIDALGREVNVKSFKIPHLVNRIAYAYIRGSKAKHSFDYGMRLREMGVHTPEPIAYVETIKGGLFNRSYYISKHHKYDFTIRDLIGFEFEDKDNILRQFAKFTYQKLHLNGVHHLDYSRGNILITRNGDNYHFSIVDINRMRFEKMDYYKGLCNFSQIWADADELAVVAREYARLNNRDEEEAVRLLVEFDRNHKKKINRKKQIKQKMRGSWFR